MGEAALQHHRHSDDLEGLLELYPQTEEVGSSTRAECITLSTQNNRNGSEVTGRGKVQLLPRELRVEMGNRCSHLGGGSSDRAWPRERVRKSQDGEEHAFSTRAYSFLEKANHALSKRQRAKGRAFIKEDHLLYKMHNVCRTKR
jgi:hypothetical protein